MRFGIMGMQLDALIPPGSQPHDLLAHIARFDHAALARDLHAQGFNPIELGGDLSLFLPNAFAPDAIAALADLRRSAGLTYTVHLPLWSVEPSTPLRQVRLGSVQAVAEIIKATRPLEPEVYVFHSTGALAAEFYQMRLPDAGKRVILQQFVAGARASIEALLSETGLPSRRLAIETIEFPIEHTLQLAEYLDLSICLDVGHVLAGFSGPIDLWTALDHCLPRLAEIHLHDAPWQGPNRTIGYGKDHQPLGAGDLDVARLLARLEEAEFAGPLIFELTLREALPSLALIRKLRPDLIAAV